MDENHPGAKKNLTKPQKEALDELIKAGNSGIVPMENPAPRWSPYIHGLRSLGIEIDTIMEPHEGPFPGKHGRYVLQSLVLKGGAA